MHHPETSRWHYVDIPNEKTEYDPGRDCAVTIAGDRVLASIERERDLIMDPDAGVFDRADALKRLVHWIGDVHQPFHATQRIVDGKPDAGGNGFRVRFFAPSGQNTNMHALWDSGLLMRQDVLVEDLVSDLLTNVVPGIPTAEASESDPINWALSSHAVANVTSPTCPEPPKSSIKRTSTETCRPGSGNLRS